MGICFKHLKEQERWVIEKLLYENCSITYIAKVINKDKSTVSREIKRGTITILNSNLQEKEIYDAKAGQRVYEENRKKSYNEPKYKNNTDLMKSIESKILYDKSSPRETSYYLSDTKNITVSYSTIYRYIEKKYFDSLRIKDLPCADKIRYKKIHRDQKSFNAGTNIYFREEVINNRERFGDWEMDCIEGKKKVSNKVLFNLTERKTRVSLLFLLDNHTGNEVLNVFNKLENVFGEDFNNIFKSISTDNGHEFDNVDKLEKSLYSNNKRTNIFYCDAYKPYQKGTVENQNKLIRRHIKKGEDFDDISLDDVDYIKSWINNYYRKLFNGKTSYQILREEFKINNIDDKYLSLFE